MARHATTWLAAAVLMLGASAAAVALSGVFNPKPGWQEIAWPFPRDAWPKGRAFRCTTAECGGEMEVYLRPKVGFCNCTSGVSGDDEVDAVTDLDMITPDFRPRQAGTDVTMAGMAGRMRSYTLHLPGGATRPAAGFALSSRCDLIVAASQGDAAGSPKAGNAIGALIASDNVLNWIKSQLGKS